MRCEAIVVERARQLDPGGAAAGDGGRRQHEAARDSGLRAVPAKRHLDRRQRPSRRSPRTLRGLLPTSWPRSDSSAPAPDSTNRYASSTSVPPAIPGCLSSPTRPSQNRPIPPHGSSRTLSPWPTDPHEGHSSDCTSRGSFESTPRSLIAPSLQFQHAIPQSLSSAACLVVVENGDRFGRPNRAQPVFHLGVAREVVFIQIEVIPALHLHEIVEILKHEHESLDSRQAVETC